MTHLTISDIGYHASQVNMLTAVSRRSHGLILFAGRSGSGKATAQRALADAIAAENGSVLDLYEVKRSQTSCQSGGVLHHLMRRSFDLLLMGDVREKSDGEIVQRLIETGHQVAGSVHAHLVQGIVPRLSGEQVGMSREFLALPNVIALLVYQALARKTCKHCSLSVDEILVGDASWDHCKNLVSILKERFTSNVSAVRFRRLGGCAKCLERGWTGTKVIAEMVKPDATWLSLIRDGDDQGACMHWRSQSDRRVDSPEVAGKTAFEQCLHLALNGVVDPRECLSFEDFENYTQLH